MYISIELSSAERQTFTKTDMNRLKETLQVFNGRNMFHIERSFVTVFYYHFQGTFGKLRVY